MRKNILLLCLTFFVFNSCTIMKDVEVTKRTAEYSINLSSVDSPANPKEQFGNTIITERQNDTIRYIYEDDYFKINWYVGSSRLYFTLYNKSKHALKINWDEASFVFPDNSISRVMHSGVKYSQRNDSQVPTTIPKGAKLYDEIVPTEKVEYSSVLGWYVSSMFKKTFDTDEELNRAKEQEGKSFSVLLPIKIEDTQNDYTFVFSVDSVNVNKKVETKQVHDYEAESVASILTAFGISGGILLAIIVPILLL